MFSYSVLYQNNSRKRNSLCYDFGTYITRTWNAPPFHRAHTIFNKFPLSNIYIISVTFSFIISRTPNSHPSPPCAFAQLYRQFPGTISLSLSITVRLRLSHNWKKHKRAHATCILRTRCVVCVRRHSARVYHIASRRPTTTTSWMCLYAAAGGCHKIKRTEAFDCIHTTQTRIAASIYPFYESSS